MFWFYVGDGNDFMSQLYSVCRIYANHNHTAFGGIFSAFYSNSAIPIVIAFFLLLSYIPEVMQ